MHKNRAKGSFIVQVSMWCAGLSCRMVDSCILIWASVLGGGFRVFVHIDKKG